jgi:hypothetical protein
MDAKRLGGNVSMIELMRVYVENSNLRMENARLERQLAQQKEMNWAFTSETEHRINKMIHAIKCRDEVPGNIFLGRKEWDALKAIAGNPISDEIDGRYMGYTVVKVGKATFVDVSTVQ